MIRLIKQDASTNIERLDRRLLTEPSIALTGVLATTKVQLVELLYYIKGLIRESEQQKIDFVNLQVVLDDTHAFVDLIHLDSQHKPQWSRLVTIIHILDHMQRLHERCSERRSLKQLLEHKPELDSAIATLNQDINVLAEMILHDEWQKAFKIAESCRNNLTQLAEPVRHEIMTDIAEGGFTVPEATAHLEALRWLQRIMNHVFRISFHLKQLKTIE